MAFCTYDLIDALRARTAYTCEISLMLVSDNRVTRNSDGVISFKL